MMEGEWREGVLRRSMERSSYHPRVRNPPFTTLSTTSTAFSGLEESRDGENKNVFLHAYKQRLHIDMQLQTTIPVILCTSLHICRSH